MKTKNKFKKSDIADVDFRNSKPSGQQQADARTGACQKFYASPEIDDTDTEDSFHKGFNAGAEWIKTKINQ